MLPDGQASGILAVKLTLTDLVSQGTDSFDQSTSGCGNTSLEKGELEPLLFQFLKRTTEECGCLLPSSVLSPFCLPSLSTYLPRSFCPSSKPPALYYAKSHTPYPTNCLWG